MVSILDSLPMQHDEVSDLVRRATKQTRVKPERVPGQRKPYACSRCGEIGHNAQTCGREQAAPDERVARHAGGRSGDAARYVREHGCTLKEAALRFGISHQAVNQAWARMYPDEPVPTALETGWKRLQAVSLAFDGKTVAEIAEVVGCDTGSVYVLFRRLGVAFEPGVGNAADQAAIDAAIAEVEAGASMVEAAIDNGIGREPLRKAMRERGIESSAVGAPRHGGLARAWALVEQGTPIPDAARIGRVAASSLYAKRARLIRERAEARQ